MGVFKGPLARFPLHLEAGQFSGADVVMTSEQRQNEYLKKAREAEEQAAKCHDAQQRDSWLRIAASYRALAKPN